MADSLDDRQLESIALSVAESLGYIIHERFDGPYDQNAAKGEAWSSLLSLVTNRS